MIRELFFFCYFSSEDCKFSIYYESFLIMSTFSYISMLCIFSMLSLIYPCFLSFIISCSFSSLNNLIYSFKEQNSFSYSLLTKLIFSFSSKASSNFINPSTFYSVMSAVEFCSSLTSEDSSFIYLYFVFMSASFSSISEEESWVCAIQFLNGLFKNF